MHTAVKRIGVLTSGGDAPGMNAVIRSVLRTSLHLGIECVGIKRGFNGLISGDTVALETISTSRLMRSGGTVLYTARSEKFMTPEGQAEAAETCRRLGLEGVVGCGGDGTFRGLRDLAKQGIAVVGIPCTIDNDIGCSSYTIGFDTACNTAIESIDRLRDTMQSHERCSVVEVMGRHAGHLALYVGVACGATCVLIPETVYDFETDIAVPIRRARAGGRTHFTIIVAEGVGGTYDIASRIEQELGLDTRVTVLGHVQRGGSPSARDRVAATYMGYDAVMLLARGESDRVVCIQEHSYTNFDMTVALAMRKGVDQQTYTVLRAHTGIAE